MLVVSLCAAAHANWDSDGNVVANGTISEPVPLPTTATTAGAAVDLFDFDIVDGGTSDGLQLTVSQIVLRTSGTASTSDYGKVTWRLSGPDASDFIGVYHSGNNTITFAALAIEVANGSFERYVVNGFYNDNTGLTEGVTFILSIDGDDDLTVEAGTDVGSTAAVTNGSGTAVRVTASQLVFTTPPAAEDVEDPSDEVVSGRAFTTQPVVTAQDGAGNTDLDFAESVSIAVSTGDGAVGGTTTTVAENGVADFGGSGILYEATGDGEAFTLQADDGLGGLDPTPVPTAVLSADVVATQLAFTTSPWDPTVQNEFHEVVNGQAFATQPAVTAQDGQGLTDTDFAENVTITLTAGVGTLSGTTTTAAAFGVADFRQQGLTYSVQSDGESFTLQADDAADGIDPAAATTSDLSADVITTSSFSQSSPIR